RTIFVTAATAIAANAMATKHPSLAILCLKNSHIEGGFYFLGEQLDIIHQPSVRSPLRAVDYLGVGD
ncbi:MAG: hypothetical protein AB7Q64_22550, partial [Verrucomicrobiales bacterium]